jgi:AcrR family transcriptional regulator
MRRTPVFHLAGRAGRRRDVRAAGIDRNVHNCKYFRMQIPRAPDPPERPELPEQPGPPESGLPASTGRDGAVPGPTMPEPVSRRQTRRAATWRAVHESAVQEVLERGLAEATVASIATRAGVSPRTFFNYFPTKEDAVLGTREPALSEDLFAAFLADPADPLTRTVRLVAAVLRTGTDAGPAFRRRRELVRTFPELRRRTLQHVQAAERITAAALEERLGPDALAVNSEDRFAALLMLAGTVVRYAFTRDPDGFHADHAGAVDSALAVFRGVLGTTSPANAP